MINDYFKYRLYRKYETSDGVTFTPLDEYQAYNEVALPNKDCGFGYDGILVLNNAKHTIIKKGDSLSKLYYVEGGNSIDTNVTGEIKGTTLEGNQNSTYYISMTPNYASYSHLFDDTNYHGDDNYDLKSIYIDFNGIDTSSLTDMSYMFNNCQDVESIILKNINTSNVTDMSYMFYYVSAYSDKLKTLDISSFNTSKVTNMSSMFYNFRFNTLDLSNFNTSNVTNMDEMFRDASIANLDISNFNFTKASTNSMFFTTNLSKIIAKNCVVSSKFPSFMMIRYLDASNISITSSKYFRIFYGIEYLETAICNDLNQTNCPRLTSFNSAFNLDYIKHIELNNMNLPLLTDVSYMFNNMSSLEHIEITGIDVSKLENYDNMFYNTENVNYIKCNIEFKEWCIQHQNEINLPSQMREEGFGTWEIV